MSFLIVFPYFWWCKQLKRGTFEAASLRESYFNMGGIQRLKGLNVANHLEKRSLLIAINSIAALSIFFFGYDQGMMGGVNVSISQPI